MRPTASPNRPEAENVRLSTQQREILKWMASGKTAWETSVIMQCTEANVNYHIRELFRKLQVVNKSQAVSKAIELDLIDSGRPGHRMKKPLAVLPEEADRA